MPSIVELKKRPIYAYLMVLTFGQAASFLGWNAIYTNFAVEVAHLTGQQNGIIQSFRELPGLLSVGVIGLLLIFKENTVCSLSVLLCGLGVVCAGWFPTFWGQLWFTFALSLGFHYFEAVNQSLTLQHFELTEAPLVISQLRSVTAKGSLTMGLIIVLLSGTLDWRFLFGLAGSTALAAGIWSFWHKPDNSLLVVQRKGFVLKKRYWLFYVLTILSGARRQIFNVFAIFLLVQHFKFTLFQMSLLLLLNNLINLFLNPFIGLAINSVGEKKLLTAKYSVVFLLCLTYAACNSAALAAILYIVDQISFCFTVSLRTYFQKMADPKDIAPSMAVGVTVNHIVAVMVPFIGGLLWMIDRRIPFLMGAGFAALSLIMTSFIDYQKAWSTENSLG
ncbi:MAG: MFS transporter [Deltaproteobacteria bacterium]|jgi:MFS family permease|nr:MFS transporter [Deltaproteobacteria bacterium]